MKNYLKVFILICSFTACEKGIEKNKLFIRGRLFFTDTLSQNIFSKELPNRQLSLSYNNSDSLNYLYTMKTDGAGYFIFNLPTDADSNYIIRFEDTISSLKFTGKTSAVKGDDNKVLIAQLDTIKQNLLSIRVVDSLNGPIPFATIYLYNSEVLAGTNDPAGALQTLSSDAYGKIFKNNLPVGTYYLNGKKQSGTLTIQRLKKKIVIPTLSGLVRDSMMLK